MHRNTHVSSRSTYAGPKNSRSTSVGSTVLVNLDVYIVRATIGRDISPEDDDLIVLFRRNSKEVTSEPTRWHDDHIAEWNQHVGIQTSLLRNKQAVEPTDYLNKEYEIVLVALPSHSAVALFTIDFAEIVQSQRANRPKPFRMSPTKCRDLAATLEFEVVWEYASPPPPLMPMTPTSSSVATTSSSSISMAGRRTNVSVVSMSSQNSELPEGSCSDCRSMRRRLERKENQIIQLENFLKESQKRIDSLVFENEELAVREQAETKNAGQYRALNMRLLQELEMAFQFCAQQMMQITQQAAANGTTPSPQLFMFLPQFEFMDRVKKFHTDMNNIYSGLTNDELAAGKTSPTNPMDAWKTFNLREEMDAALERNQRLQQQLEFLTNSLTFEGQFESDIAGVGGVGGLPQPEMRRKVTNTSTASDFSITDLNGSPHEDPMLMSRVAPVRTVTEQLNALERENFLLKAKLESAMNDIKSHSGRGGSPSESAETSASGSSTSRNSLITASLSLLPAVPDNSPLRLEVDQLRDDKLALEKDLAEMKMELERVRKENQLQLQRDSMTPPRVPSSPVNHSTNGMSSSQVSSGSGGGSDFLNKIYMDVGKAKVALEEKVKRLNQELAAAQDENSRLQEQLKLSMEKESHAGTRSSDEGMDEPKIVELHSDDEEGPVTASATGSSTDGDSAHRVELELQIQQLQQVIEEKSSQLKVQEQELQFMKQHLKEKATAAADMETAKADIEKELGTTKQALTKAEKKITALEIKIETLQVDHRQQQRESEEKHAVAIKSPSIKDDDVSELTKQLKLARQEVMQLRYRSNNLESVHEKLEDALKEKKSMQVKLTALEGQLYEQRSRTISGNSMTPDGVKDSALIEELHRQLDQKSAQLMIAQRDIESMRRELISGPQTTAASATAASVAAAATSSKSSADIADLEAKVAKFSFDIDRLCERNEDQARRINALSERVEKTTREKYELEGIMKEMLREMDGTAPPSPSRSPEASSVSEVAYEAEEYEELEEKAPAPVPVRNSGNKAMERYASALKTTFERRGSAPRAPAPTPSPPRTPSSSKVAHLIKNFSSEEASGDSDPAAKRRGTFTNSIKKITKIDFRQRQGSEPRSEPRDD